MERVNEGKQTIEAMLVGLFGRIIEDDDLYEIAKERHGGRKKDSKINKNYRLFKVY